MSYYSQGLLSHFNQVLYDLCLYKAQISFERLQDHWSSGFILTLGKVSVFFGIILNILFENEPWRSNALLFLKSVLFPVCYLLNS